MSAKINDSAGQLDGSLAKCYDKSISRSSIAGCDRLTIINSLSSGVKLVVDKHAVVFDLIRDFLSKSSACATCHGKYVQYDHKLVPVMNLVTSPNVMCVIFYFFPRVPSLHGIVLN